MNLIEICAINCSVAKFKVIFVAKKKNWFCIMQVYFSCLVRLCFRPGTTNSLIGFPSSFLETSESPSPPLPPSLLFYFCRYCLKPAVDNENSYYVMNFIRKLQSGKFNKIKSFVINFKWINIRKTRELLNWIYINEVNINTASPKVECKFQVLQLH